MGKAARGHGVDHMLGSMQRQQGSADILLFFDGMSLECREVIAGTMAAARNSCEIWVHYEPRGAAWHGPRTNERSLG